MGIRFYCPNGHKIHVKAFLAGRRGICPTCGVSVHIPLESTRPPGSKDLPNATYPAPEERQQRVNLHKIGTNAEKMDLVGGVPFQSSTDNVEGKEINIQTLPQETSDERGDLNKTPEPMQEEVPQVSDPVEEAPNAMWYVRPRSGGQYGPVQGSVIKTWLSEERIASDTLVWHEGWSDWKTGADVFPQFKKIPVLKVGTPEVGHVLRKSKGGRKNLPIIISVSVVAVILFLGILFYIMSK